MGRRVSARARCAILAYNHADWYVVRVLAWAVRYRGARTDAALGGGARRVLFDGTWLAPVPGTTFRCDARIVPDVRFLLERFGLRLTACFAASGHAAGGEHPLGLAVDLVPVDGDWSRTMQAARSFDWSPDCAANGCAGHARAPMRVVLYNGYPGHGDPAHCAPPDCSPHLHLSWAHAPTPPLNAGAVGRGPSDDACVTQPQGTAAAASARAATASAAYT